MIAKRISEMSEPQSTYFDQAAATWDDNPVRVALMKAVAGAIIRQVQPTPEMAMLDYGCGTGLVSFFLAPHVGNVTAADSSEGMLTVLRQKIERSGVTTIRPVLLDLERDPLPGERYDLIVTNMVMHHVADAQTSVDRSDRFACDLLWGSGSWLRCDHTQHPQRVRDMVHDHVRHNEIVTVLGQRIAFQIQEHGPNRRHAAPLDLLP